MTCSSSIRRAAPVPKPECCSEIGKRVLSRSLRDITGPQPLMFKSDYDGGAPVSRRGLDYGEAGVLVVRLRSSPYGLLRTDPTAGAHGSPPAGPNTRTDLHTPSTLPGPVELIEQRSTGRRQPYDPRRDPHWRLYLTGETTMANRETHILNPAWPGLVGLCGRRDDGVRERSGERAAELPPRDHGRA